MQYNHTNAALMGMARLLLGGSAVSAGSLSQSLLPHLRDYLTTQQGKGLVTDRNKLIQDGITAKQRLLNEQTVSKKKSA